VDRLMITFLRLLTMFACSVGEKFFDLNTEVGCMHFRWCEVPLQTGDRTCALGVPSGAISVRQAEDLVSVPS